MPRLSKHRPTKLPYCPLGALWMQTDDVNNKGEKKEIQSTNSSSICYAITKNPTKDTSSPDTLRDCFCWENKTTRKTLLACLKLLLAEEEKPNKHRTLTLSQPYKFGVELIRSCPKGWYFPNSVKDTEIHYSRSWYSTWCPVLPGRVSTFWRLLLSIWAGRCPSIQRRECSSDFHRELNVS